MAEKKPLRDEETREASERKTSWTRPSTLPTPNPRDGVKFRWIRTNTLGAADTTNVSSRFREGYIPVKAEDHPEMKVEGNDNGNIEIGGLLLCAIPTEIAEDRAAVQNAQSYQQLEAADRNYLRESDPRMPVLVDNKRPGTNFG